MKICFSLLTFASLLLSQALMASGGSNNTGPDSLYIKWCGTRKQILDASFNRYTRLAMRSTYDGQAKELYGGLKQALESDKGDHNFSKTSVYRLIDRGVKLAEHIRQTFKTDAKRDEYVAVVLVNFYDHLLKQLAFFDSGGNGFVWLSSIEHCEKFNCLKEKQEQLERKYSEYISDTFRWLNDNFAYTRSSHERDFGHPVITLRVEAKYSFRLYMNVAEKVLDQMLDELKRSVYSTNISCHIAKTDNLLKEVQEFNLKTSYDRLEVPIQMTRTYHEINTISADVRGQFKCSGTDSDPITIPGGPK